MMTVVEAVWAKLYAMEVKVEVEWMDDEFVENPILSVVQHSAVKPVPFPRHHSKEAQPMGYIQDLFSLDR